VKFAIAGRARQGAAATAPQKALALGAKTRLTTTSMAKKIALLFAGQGAQCVGMGRDLAERYPAAADLFREADDILARNFCDIVWNGPMEELTKTSNCQPALYVHALAALAAVRAVVGEFEVGGAAGLSLGEITAHAAAGTFDFATGLRLVQKRGEFMDEACATTQGGMAAMIGGLENDVRRLAADEDVDIANINAPNQLVISGKLAHVETAVGVAKEYGIGRATMLNVAGAYHSRLMESAYVKFEKVLAHVPMQSPRFPVISNVTGEEVKTPEEIRETLRDQVTGTVRWAACMQRLIDLGCNFFIELGPGNVLAGLLKRTNRTIASISIGDAGSVEKCAAAL
jgi:[acyl-carrier-protein] S-malonyltransferase